MSSAAVLDRLLAILWDGYKNRVVYAATYENMVAQRGGKAQNDHLAFRTFNCHVGDQPAGVMGIARIFEALGYEKKDLYLFEDKHLTAWHWQHKTNESYPKIFISQLEVDQLSPAAVDKIRTSVKDAPDRLASGDRELLKDVAGGKVLDTKNMDDLAARLAGFFTRPWSPPLRGTVESVDKESQYAAWTLLHGNSVNHFTAYINEQHVKEWPDIEATVHALRAAGVPMKDEFEGEAGSKLRQSSTRAAMEDCDVTEADGSRGKLNWSYAYYELAERGNVPGPGGKPVRFHGFLGAQATNLFEMTKRG